MVRSLLRTPSIAYIKKVTCATPPKSMRVWGRMIGEFYADTCIVTGLTKGETRVEKHHIYNVFDYPHLKLNPFNGIILTRELHLMLHRLYGTKVTADDLLDFFQKLKKTEYKQYFERILEATVWVSQLKQAVEMEDYK